MASRKNDTMIKIKKSFMRTRKEKRPFGKLSLSWLREVREEIV